MGRHRSIQAENPFVHTHFSPRVSWNPSGPPKSPYLTKSWFWIFQFFLVLFLKNVFPNGRATAKLAPPRSGGPPWAPHGVPWGPMGPHGSPMGPHGVPWGPHGPPMGSHGAPWAYLGPSLSGPYRPLRAPIGPCKDWTASAMDSLRNGQPPQWKINSY